MRKPGKAALKAIITTQVASLGLYLATAYFFAISGSFQFDRSGFLNGRRQDHHLHRRLDRRVGQVGATALPFLAAGCDGGTNTDQRLPARRLDGQGGRVHLCALPDLRRQSPAGDRRYRWDHGSLDDDLWLYHVFPAERHEEAAGIFDHHPALVHFPGAVALDLWLSPGLQRCGGAYLQPCLCQEPVLPGGRGAELHHRHAHAAELARDYEARCRWWASALPWPRWR